MTYRPQSYLVQFHEAYEQARGEAPTPELTRLRRRLITEEYEEVLEEFSKRVLDPEKLCKELADLLYVVYGTAVAFGYDLESAFEAVHESNMSKLGEDGKPIRDKGGKALKGPNYFEPDMRPFVPLTVDHEESPRHEGEGSK